MTMHKVVAQARLRKQHDQEFRHYWCAGKCWSGLTPSEHILTDMELEALKKEESEGMPIHLISVDLPDEPVLKQELSSAPSSTIITVPSSTPPWAQHN